MAIRAEGSTTRLMWETALVEEQVVGGVGGVGALEACGAVAGDGEAAFAGALALVRRAARGGLLVAFPAFAQCFGDDFGHGGAGGGGDHPGEADRFGVLDGLAHAYEFATRGHVPIKSVALRRCRGRLTGCPSASEVHAVAKRSDSDGVSPLEVATELAAGDRLAGPSAT